MIDAPSGTLIAYSTSPGMVAADGKERNSPYTGELLNQIQAPGLEIEKVFKQVRVSVMEKTENRQVPWESSSLTGDFYFRPPHFQPASEEAEPETPLENMQSLPLEPLPFEPLPMEPLFSSKGKQKSNLPRQSSRRIAIFRSIPMENLETAEAILAKWGFYEKDDNPTGKGFANDYELQMFRGGKVVIDHASGLMWEQSGSDTYMDHTDAQTFHITELNKKNYAGFNDWRLPTLEEAMSLMEPEEKNANLFIDPLFDKKQLWIWTADLNGAPSPWIVDFRYGGCYTIHADSNSDVRAVRGR